MEQPNYYGIIPANVRYDKSLSASAKILYSEVSALCNKKGYCYASNRYFAELYNVSIVSISTWVKNLCDKKYLVSHIIFKQGTKEVLERRLYIVPPPQENFSTPPQENFSTPPQENFKDNNTRNNNTRTRKDEEALTSFHSLPFSNIRAFSETVLAMFEEYEELDYTDILEQLEKAIHNMKRAYKKNTPVNNPIAFFRKYLTNLSKGEFIKRVGYGSDFKPGDFYNARIIELYKKGKTLYE